jgi:hypothetical protein
LASDHRPFAWEQRKQGNDGESRNGHFEAGFQRSRMAGIIGSRKADQDELTFPEAPGDD